MDAFSACRVCYIVTALTRLLAEAGVLWGDHTSSASTPDGLRTNPGEIIPRRSSLEETGGAKRLTSPPALDHGESVLERVFDLQSPKANSGEQPTDLEGAGPRQSPVDDFVAEALLTCPPFRYGRECRSSCHCDRAKSESCDPVTGKCHCEKGYTGIFCKLDVNECKLDPYPCTTWKTYCVNTFGSYKCLCTKGYRMARTGRACLPCPANAFGEHCEKTCDCHPANTIHCDGTSASCMCELGWTGPYCSEGVDDCVGNPCGDKTCVDKYRHHVCLCPSGQRFINGECEDFVTRLVAVEDIIRPGDLIDVFILFKLHRLYQTAFTNNPNFIYKIYDVSEKQLCTANLFYDSRLVMGDEWFLKKLQLSMKYNYYIHFKMQVENSSFTQFRAVPTNKEYEELVLSLNARPPSQAVKDCLTGMYVEGTTPKPDKRNIYKRQAYNKFRVNMKHPEKCGQTPVFEWSYATVDDNIRVSPKTCLDGSLYKDLDIDEAIDKSGERCVSDHRSQEEVIPKNTLPLGYVLIRINAYVSRNRHLSRAAYGYIYVVPSYTVEGRILPPLKSMTFPPGYRCILDLGTDFKETDMNSELKYTWSCDLNYEGGKPCTTKSLFRITSEDNYKTVKLYGACLPDGYYITVTASMVESPFISTRKSIYVQSWNDGQFFTFKCLRGCDEVIGTSQIVEFQLEFSRFPSILCWWKVKVDGKTMDAADRRDFLDRNEEGTLIKTRPGKLGPGLTYELWGDCAATWSNGDVTEAYLKYLFRTEPPPVGDGCTVTPKHGKAVFTRFNITCHNYRDTLHNLPLYYKLYQKDRPLSSGEVFYSLIAYTSVGTMPRITLSTVETRKTRAKVYLRMDIINVEGTATSVFMDVTLVTDDQRKILRKMGSVLESLNTGTQEDIRSLKDVATVISKKATASVEDKQKTREVLLKNLGKVQTNSADSVEQASYVMEKCAFKEEEITPIGLDHGIKTCHRLSRYLGKVVDDNFETTLTVAQEQVHSVSRLLSVSSDAGRNIADRNQTDAVGQFWRDKNINQSLQGTDSFSQISKVLKTSLVSLNDTVRLNSENAQLGVGLMKVGKDSSFNVAGDKITFDLPSEGTGAPEDEVMETEFEVFKKNPYNWERIPGNMPVVKVDMVRQSTKEKLDTLEKKPSKFRFSQPADIFIDFESTAEPHNHTLVTNVQTVKGESFIHHSSCIYKSFPASTSKALVIRLDTAENVILRVIVRYAKGLSVFDELSEEMMLEMPLTNPTSIRTQKGVLWREKNLLFLPQLPKMQKKQDKYYRLQIMAKLHQKVNVKNLEPVPAVKSKTTRETNTKKKDDFKRYRLTVQLTPHEMACLHFDELKKSYLSDECMVSMYSNLRQIHCRCLVAAAFTGSLYVVPQFIDPSDIALFAEVFKNPLPVSMVIGIWMTYITLMLWGRRGDRDDEIKRGVTVLEDNKQTYTYVYQVGVSTGWAPGAATTSNVYLYIKGFWNHSDYHALYDTSRRLFDSGATNWFLLTTKEDLGDLRSVVVWTDSSGGHPSWFLNSVYVQNMQTNESWMFLYNSWISATYGSGQLHVEIPGIKEKDYTKKWKLQVRNKGVNDIRNEHLWISIIAKTPYNKFTRVRRLTTALTMLQSLMMLNLLFFGMRDKNNPGQFVELLDQKIHVVSIIIGIQCSFIMTALGLGIGFLFNRVSPRPGMNTGVELKFDKNSLETRLKDELDNGRQDVLVFDTANSNFFSRFMSTPKELVDSRTQRLMLLPQHSITSRNASTDRRLLSAISVGIGEAKNSLKRLVESEPDNVNNNSSEGSSVEQENEKIAEAPEKTKEEGPAPEPAPTEAKPFMLPWWFIYVTWSLLVAYNLFLAYYLMLHGLSLGYENSADWFLAFFTGFLTDAFITQPIKVLFMAFLLVLVFEHKHTLKEQAPLTKLTDTVQIVQEKQTAQKLYGKSLIKRDCKAPLNVAEAKRILERLSIESKARKMMRDLFTYSIFVIAVFIVSVSHLNVEQRFLQNQFVQNVFLGVRVPSYEGDAEMDLLSEVKRTEDMWSYLKTTVMPHVVKDENTAQIMIDYYLIGPARLRQVRVKPGNDNCERLPRVMQNSFSPDMCGDVIDGHQETRNFNRSWQVEATSFEAKEDNLHFIYRSPASTRTLPYAGVHGTYPGGGYIAPLGRESLQANILRMDKLDQGLWIDQLTRCLFLEFTLYNPSSRLYTNVVLAFEFYVTGAVVPSKSTTSAQLQTSQDSKSSWLLYSELLTAVCIVYYTVLEIQSMLNLGFKAYFSEFWNVIEVITLLVGYSVAIFSCLRIIAYENTMSKFRTFGHSYFIDFGSVFHMQFLQHISFGLLGAMAIFKLLKVTMFNPFMQSFVTSIEISLTSFYGFSLITAVYLLALASWGMLTFGSHTDLYKSMWRSLISLFFFILGEPDFDDLVDVNTHLGRIYFFVVMVITQYIIINFFIAILREGLEIARFMEFRKENATVKYMVETFLLFFGIGSQNVRRT